MSNIHKISEHVEPNEDIRAKSHTTAQTSAKTYDLTNYMGSIYFGISAGTFGASATLDAKLEESVNSNMSSPSDVASGAITQMTAAGFSSIEVRVRAFTKRYVRLKVTPAVAAVEVGAWSVAQKRNL